MSCRHNLHYHISAKVYKGKLPADNPFGDPEISLIHQLWRPEDPYGIHISKWSSNSNLIQVKAVERVQDLKTGELKWVYIEHFKKREAIFSPDEIVEKISSIEDAVFDDRKIPFYRKPYTVFERIFAKAEQIKEKGGKSNA